MISPDERRIDAIPMHSTVKQTRIRVYIQFNGLAMNNLISKNKGLFDWADVFLLMASCFIHLENA